MMPDLLLPLKLLQILNKTTLYILPLSRIKNNTFDNFVFVENPLLSYIDIIKHFCGKHKTENIHPTAIVDKEAKIHPSVCIGAFSIVDKCEIGEGTVVMEHCHIYDNTYIGKNVRIHPSCEIGTEDFGAVKASDSKQIYLLPQVGSLVIEDDVEIFPFTAIGRGAIDKTVLHKGVKIDHCCQIGHNTDIGENTVVTANSVILGSTHVGRNCWIGSCSVIKEHLTIGNDVTVGIGAVVTKSAPDNITLVGNPAIELKQSINDRKILKTIINEYGV